MLARFSVKKHCRHAMRRVVPIRDIRHAMRARARVHTYTGPMSHTWPRGLRNARVRRRRHACASLRERARAERAAAAAAGRSSCAPFRSPRPRSPRSRQLQEVEKVDRAAPGAARRARRGARVLLRSRDGLERVAVARNRVLHDVEKMFCAILSICSSKNGMSSAGVTSSTYSWPRKIIDDTRFTLMCGASRSEKDSSRPSQQRLAPRCAGGTP